MISQDKTVLNPTLERLLPALKAVLVPLPPCLTFRRASQVMMPSLHTKIHRQDWEAGGGGGLYPGGHISGMKKVFRNNEVKRIEKRIKANILLHLELNL